MFLPRKNVDGVAVDSMALYLTVGARCQFVSSKAALCHGPQLFNLLGA